QKIRYLLEARFLRHLVDVVAAIHHARVRIDPADLRLPRDHSGEARAVSRFGFFSRHLGDSLLADGKRSTPKNEVGDWIVERCHVPSFGLRPFMSFLL